MEMLLAEHESWQADFTEELKEECRKRITLEMWEVLSRFDEARKQMNN